MKATMTIICKDEKKIAEVMLKLMDVAMEANVKFEIKRS